MTDTRGVSLREFRVYLRTVASTVIEVEASNEEEAVEKAFDHAPSLCAHCSGWGQKPGIEIAEWEPCSEPWPAMPGDIGVEAVSE